MTNALILKPGAPVAEIILNRPGKRNAINAAMWAQLGAAVRAANEDANVRAIIIRGEGEHFAAGADIGEFDRIYTSAENAAKYTDTMLASLKALEGTQKPAIAMIRGACVGGGCSIALACDFRFVAKDARIGVTPSKLGLVYPYADIRRLSDAIGLSNAKDLLFTGRLINAEEAGAMGFCDRLFDVGDLEEKTFDYAEEIAEVSSWSIGATKKMLALLRDGARDDDERAARLLQESFSSPDFAEGYKAFLEKRKPNFSST